MKNFFCLLFAICLFKNVKVDAQGGVAVNSDGSAAASSAMLDIKSTTKGMLVPRMSTAQRTTIANLVKGLLVFDNNTSSFWFYNGSAWTELSTGAGNTNWVVAGTNISNSNSGNVGIGTSVPTEKLDVVGNINSSGRIDAGGVMEAHGISSLGGLYVTGSTLLQGALTGTTSSFSGTVTSNTGININDPTGIVQFKNAGSDLAFVQLSGNDLRLGTNADNVNGNVIVRTQGANQVIMNSQGITLADGAKLKQPATGSRSLIPFCYGQVAADGTVLSGSGNFIVSKEGIGAYVIHVDGANSSTFTMVIPDGNAGSAPVSIYANYNASYNGIYISTTHPSQFSRDQSFKFMAFN